MRKSSGRIHPGLILAVAACKLCRKLLRLVGGGGTSFPGKLARKLCPAILSYLSDGVRVIVVSGTNGKTTTCRMIERSIEANGVCYFANRSGANLLPGVVAEFADQADWLGRPTKEVAVIECDEAALKAVLDYVKPEIIVLTNIFRDQLDRYGEVSHTLENLKIAVAKAPKATLCLNADDSLIVSIASALPNRCVFYGMDLPDAEVTDSGISDAMYCIRCKHRYSYRYLTYGHLGGFYCEKCGYKRPKAQIAVEKVLSQDTGGSVVMLRLHDKRMERRVPLPANYNIYNYLATVTAMDVFGLPIPEDEALEGVKGFGRMEQFALGKGVTMILVKNPAGFTQVIEYLAGLSGEFDLMCCLNDQLADGTDISWIWDVPMEKLTAHGEHLKNVFVSGLRKEDMFLRLKHAGLPVDKLQLTDGDRQFVDSLAEHPRPLIIVPTYTAMMKLRPLIAEKTNSKVFWE